MSVCSLVLRDWHRGEGERRRPRDQARAPRGLSFAFLFSYYPLHRLLERTSHEDDFVDPRLVGADVVFCIDVGRIDARAAVDLINLPVHCGDRVIAGATEQHVVTEIAIYAVVTVSAKYLVGTTAAVAIVLACQTPDSVCGTESVDPVHLIGALEVVLPESAP